MADMQKQGNDMSTHVTLNTINVVVHAFLYVSSCFLSLAYCDFALCVNTNAILMLCGGNNQCWINIHVYHRCTKQIHDCFFPKQKGVI